MLSRPKRELQWVSTRLSTADIGTRPSAGALKLDARKYLWESEIHVYLNIEELIVKHQSLSPSVAVMFETNQTF